MKRIRVLVVDDHVIVRDGLRALLEAASDMEVIGEAENGRQAVLETARLRPDVVLLDLGMPLLNGVEAARQIAEDTPDTKVLILSSYSDAQHVRQAMEAGVAGYLMKECAAAHLLEAVRTTNDGGAWFSPALAKLRSNESPDRAKTMTPSLSRREAEVLQLIAEGHNTTGISEVLSVAVKTVEKQRQALMDKLKIHRVAHLTRYAVRNGIVESDKYQSSLNSD